MKQIVFGTPFEQPLRHCVRTGRSILQAAKRLVTPKDINQRYDEETFAVMKRTLSRGSNCVDVGCHLGEMLRECIRLAPQGQHFAFEPLPHLFGILRSEFGNMPNVSLYDCVLSDCEGTTHFQHVVSNPAFSGIQKRSYPRENEQVVEIEVKQVPLDFLIPETQEIDFIKIDVEGAELQVLRGAKKTIERPITTGHNQSRYSTFYAMNVDCMFF